jgi:CBS domain-containing protein
MAQSVREVMTSAPKTVDAAAPVVDVARIMADADVGAVVVVDGGQVAGIVTDRDVTVRAVAKGRDPASTPVREVCSAELTTLALEGTVDDAVRLMREKAVRRLPVVEGGRPVGIVSLGDLAVEREPQSALGDISAAPPNP